MKKRKLLLDSCVALAVAERLRADGHDVVTVSERGPDPGDAAILELAASEGRAIVTIDTDFGTLVFRDGARCVGVLRLRPARGAEQAERASKLIEAQVLRTSRQHPSPGRCAATLSHKGDLCESGAFFREA